MLSDLLLKNAFRPNPRANTMLGVKYWSKTISYSQEKIKGLPLQTFDLCILYYSSF